MNENTSSLVIVKASSYPLDSEQQLGDRTIMTFSNNQMLSATHKTARGHSNEQLRRRGKYQRQSARRRGLYVAAVK